MVLLAQLAAAAVLYLGGSGQLAEQAVRSHHGDVGTTMVQLTRRWLGFAPRLYADTRFRLPRIMWGGVEGRTICHTFQQCVG